MSAATAELEVVELVPYALTIVRRWAAARALPAEALEELEGDALVALVALAQKFDPSHGIPFRLFVARRLIFGVIDERRGRGEWTRPRQPRRELQWAVQHPTSTEVAAPAPRGHVDDRFAEVEFLATLEHELDAEELDVVRGFLAGERRIDMAHRLGVSSSTVTHRVRRLVRHLAAIPELDFEPE